jgi:hypothetical protein
MNAKIYNILLKISLLTLFFAIMGCSTSTNISSWQEETTTSEKFGKIFVMVLIRDLEYRIIFENKLVSELNKTGIQSVQSLKKISPVEKYTKDDFDTLLQKNNFDGFLIVKYEGSLEENVKKDGTTFYKYYRKFSRPTRRKGYIESHKIVILESVLFSVLNEKSVWAATTKTKDSSGPEDLAKSYCEAIIKNLKDHNLIR